MKPAPVSNLQRRPDHALTPPELAMPPDDDTRFASLQRELTETRSSLAEAQRETRDMRLEVAELKGTILTEIRHLGHDVKNILQAMTQFIPRGEIERMQMALEKRLEETAAKVQTKADDTRLAKIEEGHTYIWRTIVGTTILGVVSWIGWYVKK